MRRFINQYVFFPLFWIMSLSLLTLFVLVVLLFTPFGPKTIAYVADNSVPSLEIEGVSGSVLTGLHIDKLALDSKVGVVLKDLDINVNKYDTQNKKIVADKLSLGELVIVLKDTNQPKRDPLEPIKLPDFGLPINLDVDHLQLDSLQIVKQLPDSDETQTLLFQIKAFALKQTTIKDGLLTFGALEGRPTILDQPLKIDVGNGSLNMNQPHELSTSGNISFAHPDLGSLDGQIEIGGTLTEYSLNTDLDFSQEKVGSGTLAVKGEGDYKKINLDEINITSDHGNIESSGKVNWGTGVRLNFHIDGRELKTKEFLPGWPITADAEIQYSGSIIDKRLENNVDIVNLEGKFRDQELRVKGLIYDREGFIRTEKLEVQLGDNTLKATGAVTEPLNLDLEVDAKNLSQILPELSGNVKGTAEVKGLYKTPEIKSQLSANKLAYGDIKQGKDTLFLNTDVELVEENLIINSLEASLGKNDITLSGQASEPFDLKWDVNAKNLSQITPEVIGQVQGSGVLKGTQKQLSTTLNLKADNFVFNEFKQGKDSLFLDGEVSLNEKIISLKSLVAKSGTNSINLSGQASEPVDLNIQVSAQNLTEVSPDLSGRVTGTAKVSGPYKSPNIKTNLLGSNLALKKQKLGKADIKLQGEVEITDGVPIVKQLNTQIGNNTFQVSGKASSPYDLTWNVDSKNLNQLLPELSGSLQVKGQLQGTIDRPIINATGDARNLKYDAFGLRSGKFIASTKDGVYRIKGDLEKLVNADQKVKSAKVELNGTIENHAITANVDHSEAKVNLKANGGWRNQTWNGSVKTLKLGDTQAGDWNLQKPTRVSISKDGFSADKLCFSSDKTQACTEASYSKARGLTAKGTVQKTPLSLLKPFLPEGLDLNGDIQGSYDIKQNNGKPTGFINFKLPDSSFSFVDGDGETQSFSYEKAEIKTNINNRTINTEARMNIINRGVFSSKTKVKLSPTDGKHTIDGSANFDVPNINFAQQFIPRSRGLRGAMNSKLTFTGLLSKPQIKGTADIKNAYLRLPEAGTEITNINLSLRADKPGQAKINGKMLMGKGVLNVTGDMDLKDIAKWKANIRISGKNIRFMNTNEIRAVMSPDINLNLTPELVGITGRIDIPEGDIRLKAIPESSIDESSDTFVIGESVAGEKVTSVKIRPRVLISLGQKVRMNAFGLEAKLSGDVNITHNRRDILANGSLRVQDGKFQAYGQDLAIDNGRLIFNGSPKLIGMDVRATRTIDKQVVGIHLGGTLLSPKSTLFAEPAVEEESEILSYLITGNTLSSASGQESALLLSAVRGLGITGSGSIVQKIGAAFGLDDVNIVTKEDLKESELQLGKRLGSRLYVKYLIGLFDQTQKIAIEYKINDVLSLEAQTTAEDFGLDFIFEIERD